MNIFRAKSLCIRISNLEAIQRRLEMLSDQLVPANLQTCVNGFAEQIRYAFNDCDTLGLGDARTTLKRVSAVLSRGGLDASALAREAARARDALLDDIDKRKFLYVVPERVVHVENANLLGEKVVKRFDSAKADIIDAGNCLAVELGTAAVFHLMRVAEHGLRALARKLHVPLTYKGQRCPIEYADWENVITGIRNKILTLRQLHKGPVKQRNLEFYSDVAEQSEYIRDVWRNTVSHARRPYSISEAQGVKERVEGFMVRLAKDLRSAR